jgi:hypothetical protein
LKEKKKSKKREKKLGKAKGGENSRKEAGKKLKTVEKSRKEESL